MVAFHNFDKAPNKKREKSIFELNAVIERPPKSNTSNELTLLIFMCKSCFRFRAPPSGCIKILYFIT